MIKFPKKLFRRKEEPKALGQCSCGSYMGRPTYFDNGKEIYWKYMCNPCIEDFKRKCQDLGNHLKEIYGIKD